MSNPERNHDLIVVGAGPVGLATAIGAQSEHLKTVVLEGKTRLGGQAGTSSEIKNYPGFPDGISGPELMGRMIQQARNFNAAFEAPERVSDIQHNADDPNIRVTGETRDFIGRVVFLGCGVDYRRLRATNLAAYLGNGVHYGSPNLTTNFEDEKVFLVGGGNNAGQAAVHLSKFSNCSVGLLIRGADLGDKMSGYLVDQILETPNIDVKTETEVTAVDGNSVLTEVTTRSNGVEQTHPVNKLFVMIGAEPRTKWLPEAIARDQYGFILTGTDLPQEARDRFEQECGRAPLSHETSMRGVFAGGDVRHGTVKRVGFSVGDGSATVAELHQYLDHKSKPKA